MSKNYGVIDTVEELRVHIDRIVDSGNVFAFDIETGYDGPDLVVGSDKVSTIPYHPTFKVAGISFTDSLEWARYVPLAHDHGQNIDNIVEAARLFWKLLSTGKGVAHNAPFELQGMARFFREYLSDDIFLGAQVRKCHGFYPVHSDTMVEAFMTQKYSPAGSAVLRGIGVGLKALTLHEFKHKMIEFMDLFPDVDSELGPATPRLKKKFVRFNSRYLVPTVIEYACEDSVWCLALHFRNFDLVKDQVMFRVEIRLMQVLAEMEYHGLHLDWNEYNQRAADILDFMNRMNEDIQQELSSRLKTLVSVNLGSPKQVAEVLYEKLGLPVKERTKTGAPSTGESALRAIAKIDPVIKRILEWREVSALLSRYIDKYRNELSYAEDKRAHPNHKQTGAATGRMSVDHVSYQQWPKPYTYELDDGTTLNLNYRNFLTAPEGFRIVGFDFSQVELRILAGMANETALLKAFADGVDIHSATAATMMKIPLDQVTEKDRAKGKTLNFAVVYGSGPENIADLLGIEVDEAVQLLEDYFAAFPGLRKWMDERVEEGQKNGYVFTRFGRKFFVWEYVEAKELAQKAAREKDPEERKKLFRWSRNQESKGNRMCVNAPVQGGAADYLKLGMVRSQAAIKKAGLEDKIVLVMTIHDALEFYVHESVSTQEVIDLISPCVSFPVEGLPEIRADWHEGDRWGDVVEISLDKNKKIVSWSKSKQEFPSFEEARTWIHSLTETKQEDAPLKSDSSLSVRVEMSDFPLDSEWRQFQTFLKSNPGPMKVSLHFQSGTVKTLEGLYTVFPHHQKEIESILSGSVVKVEKET